MKMKALNKMMRLGTPGPWEGDGVHNLVIVGGTAPKKALHEWKVKVAEIPMTDQVTGLLSASERDANVARILQLPELETMFVRAVEILKNLDDGENDEITEFLKDIS